MAGQAQLGNFKAGLPGGFIPAPREDNTVRDALLGFVTNLGGQYIGNKYMPMSKAELAQQKLREDALALQQDSADQNAAHQAWQRGFTEDQALVQQNQATDAANRAHNQDQATAADRMRQNEIRLEALDLQRQEALNMKTWREEQTAVAREQLAANTGIADRKLALEVAELGLNLRRMGIGVAPNEAGEQDLYDLNTWETVPLESLPAEVRAQIAEVNAKTEFYQAQTEGQKAENKLFNPDGSRVVTPEAFEEQVSGAEAVLKPTASNFQPIIDPAMLGNVYRKSLAYNPAVMAGAGVMDKFMKGQPYSEALGSLSAGDFNTELLDARDKIFAQQNAGVITDEQAIAALRRLSLGQ